MATRGTTAPDHGETHRSAARPDDIAVVGVGLRYAGGVRDLDALWRVVLAGEDVTSEVPHDRWDARFHSEDPGAAGTMYCTRAGFLDEIDRFDADFFGISPREAAEIDPQQRLLLETAWAAMEDSGIPRERWAGSRTGVFAGILNHDYTLLHAKTSGVAGIGPYYASGKEASFGVGRIAYTFGLHGPCMMLNSACSSSLLAVHLAVRSLRSGECDTALAGGVNLLVAPELNIFMSKIEALSPTQRCRPFDAEADGVVRGEGSGVVVLKRYADAVAANDRVLAVIEGSATNHDGHSAGLIAPNAVAQEMLLRSALADAGLEPSDVDYVEAHGTGTNLGDRIEISALSAVLGAGRDADRALFVSSHKANFGHTDAAAGVLGLLKAIAVARNGLVPPQANFTSPVEQVAQPGSGVRVAAGPTPFPGGAPRHLGVSAFGLSGTNVHVVLAPAPAAPQPPAVPEESSIPVLLVSGPTPDALAAQAVAYREVVAAGGTAGVLHSAAVRRTHHDHRLAVVGSTGRELADALTAHLAGEAAPGTASGDVLDGRPPQVVHVFSGQGSQWPGMALDLHRDLPVVRDALDECDALVREFAGWSPLAEIGRLERSELVATRIAQPAIFAVQVALSRLWSSWGVAPAAVVGHSVGEVAAAHVAGALPLRDAVRLVVERGRIMQDATGSGRMASVELPEDEVRAALEPLGLPVEVATVNGPRTVVVAGPAQAVAQAVAHLSGLGATCQPLAVDYAFHSAAVRAHGDELEALLGDLAPAAPSIPLLSSVDPESAAPVTDASYWGRNVRDAVRFWPAVDRLLSRRDAVFVEIGPHPVLSRPLRAALAHRGRRGVVVPSLARGGQGRVVLASSLAQLYAIGVEVDWAAVHAPARPHVPLPPVPLGGGRHWLTGVRRGEQGGPGGAADAVGLTGLRAEVRLFDGDQRLVATLGGPAAAPGELPAAPPTPVAAVPPPVTPPVVQPVVQPVTAPDGPVPASSGVVEQTARAVGRIAAEVLGVDRRLSRVRGFYELGFDSFSIVRLAERVRAEFGVELTPGAALEHPSVDALTEHVLTLTGGRGPQPPTADPTASAPVTAPTAPATAPTTAAPTPPATAPAAAAPARTEPASGAVEPVAIVGMACRLPGATGLDEYWSLLTSGVDATGDVPADRWDAAALLADGAVEPGTVSTARGAFVDGIDRFDNAFFRVSAREARSMDPQQRMFLEVAWEAIEDAGLAAEDLRGGRTGLFVGLNTTDYQQLITGRPDKVDLYYGTGNSFSGSAGRMSYFLGALGPSLAVDTACASSLTAVHLACQSLRAGDSDVAVAGGSNAILTPTVYLAMSAGGALAPDGRCKTFDASADGYGRGEGAGAVVLKTLSKAIADGDRVYAVINGSAINHNGASGGLTVPSADAQTEVIRAALAQGELTGDAVDYVEAHGTGTPLGDPIELTALDRALGEGRPAGRPLLVGSVKTNIAHLEAAAGVAGLIKVVLSLWHGEIPAHLHFTRPSEQVPWDRLRLRVVADRTPWPTSGRPRMAGVSALGFTGSNAHVVLAEAPRHSPSADGTPGTSRPYALAVSAPTAAALEQAADRVRRHLESGADVADLCHTLGVRRTHWEHRLVAVGANRDELLRDLAGRAHHADSARVGEPARVALVFGDQVADLAWDRVEAAEPAFRAALDAVEAEALAVTGRSVRAALRERRADPVALVAAQIALAALWSDHGVRHDVVVGRGTGEIAAAHVAGALGLREALLVANGAGFRLAAEPTVPLLLASTRPDLGGALADEGVDLALDAGSGPAAEGLGVPAVSVLPENAVDLHVRAAAELHVRGAGVDWRALLAGRGGHVSAPGHPWQHTRHWVDASPTAPTGASAAVPTFGLGPVFVPHDAPGLRYHPVRRAQANPASAATEAAELLLAAARQVVGDRPLHLRDLDLTSAAAPGADAQLVCRREHGEWSLSLLTTPSGDRAGTRVASAALSLTGVREVVDVVDPVGRTARGDALLTAAAAELAGLFGGRDLVVARIDSAHVAAKAGTTAEVVLDATVTGPDRGDVRVLSPAGEVLVDLCGVVLRPARDLVLDDDVRQRAQERLYAVRWQPSTGAAPVDPAGRWLVEAVGPQDVPAAERLVAALRRHGAQAQVREWSREPVAGDGRGVVLVSTASTGAEPVTAALRAGRALAHVASTPPRLWLVTKGAQDGAVPPQGDRAAAWGVARVLAMETPAAWGGCLDLPQDAPEDFDAVARRLLAAPVPGPVEDEARLRDGTWFVPRLAPADPLPAALPPLSCDQDAWYAVVGEHTGSPVVDRLVAAGARKLLVVRPEAGAGTANGSTAATRNGTGEHATTSGPVTVRVVSPAALEEVLADVPVAGVVVVPPVLPVRSLVDVEPEDLAVGRAVVDLATRVVHALGDRPRAFVHVIGSAAGEWGSAGSALRAALDGPLHALVATRAARGLDAAMTRWMPRGDNGELTRRDELMMGNSGLVPLTGDVVAETADVLLRAGYADVAVADVDEARYAEVCRAQTPRAFFEALGTRGGGADAPADHPALVAELLALDPDLRAGRMLDVVLRHVADVLGADDEVDPDRGYFELGMDSVMAIALKTRLDEAVGVDLPPTLTFEFPTARALADHLLGTLPGVPGEDVAAGSGPEPAADHLDGLDDLSDEELVERLLAGLAGAGRLRDEVD